MSALHISAAIFVLYAIISLVLPLKVKLFKKLLLALVVAACGSKYVIYMYSGGILNPKLPANVIVTFEVLYSFLMLAVLGAMIKDIVLLFRSVVRYIEKSSAGKRGVGKSSSKNASATGSVQFKPWPITRINAVIVTVAFVAALSGTLSQFRTPAVVEETVYVRGLPQAFDGYTIVQLTDLHIGPVLKGEFLESVVHRTNSLEPDLVLITGDLVDGSVAALKDEFKSFEQLRAKNGVLAVTGNHEYYSGANPWVKTWEQMGLKFLRNQSVLITKGNTSIQVAGIPDLRGQNMGEERPDPNAALKNIIPYSKGSYTAISASGKDGKTDGTEAFNEESLDGATFSINSKPISGIASEMNKPSAIVFMAHQPNAAAKAKIKANLILTGHTHGGTMFFLKPIIAKYNSGYVSGMYDLGNGNNLYVSNGTGIWAGFSCRILVPAEITKFTLRRM